MKVIYTLQDIENNNNSIFLAGPTYRLSSGVTVSQSSKFIDNKWVETVNLKSSEPIKRSWRVDTLDILKSLNFNGIVYVPEYEHNVRPSGWTYEKQVEWERKALDIASVIMFYIPRNMTDLPALTTNIEFGIYLKSGKIVCGAPTDSVKNDYIKYKCATDNISWNNTLQATVESTIQFLNKQTKKYWFTSDTHFSQIRTLELSKRPFKDVEEMDNVIINNWNKKINNSDIIYHLGDFGNPEIIKCLNGAEINIVPGNYDNEHVLKELKKDSRVKILELGHIIQVDDIKLKLFHEPLQCLPEITNLFPNENDFILFGHIHNTQKIKKNGLNVGVDCHFFNPVDLDYVKFQHNGIKNHYDGNVFC